MGAIKMKGEIPWINIREGHFPTKWDMESFKRTLAPEVTLLRENPDIDNYEKFSPDKGWILTYYQPPSILDDD